MAKLAASVALAAAAVQLGGLWSILLGFAALCAMVDSVVPMPTGTVGEAERIFGRLTRARRRARLTGRAQALNVLDEVHPWTRAARRRELGVQSIPLESLAGTVEPSKARQFDADWRPDPSARDRWKPLWLGRSSGSPIPPVSVFRVGDSHWVRDGHHRTSVARHQGAPTLEAEVVELA